MARHRVTEYHEVDLDTDEWVCNRCEHRLGPATRSYKRGCKIRARDPREIYQQHVAERYNFAPDPDWVRIVEFYCPGCGTMLENEFLAPGHPLTHDLELDLDALKRGGEPR